MDVLVAIRQTMPGLRPAERRVATLVLADPGRIIGCTITQLASLAGASQATVLRFCRALGYSGYPEFRIDLAQATSREAVDMERFSIEHGEINDEDTVEDVIAKLAYHEARTIEQTARALDRGALEAAVSAIAAADRIETFGIGSSALTCLDLQQKLMRIGMICFAWSDAHLALTSAALLGPSSVAIGVSHSGLTIETNHALEMAGSTGATTIAITNYPDSPLAATADEVLVTVAPETPFRSGAMASRLAQLAIIDIVFVRVAQRVFDRTTQSLKLTHDAVLGHRLDHPRKQA